MALLRHLRRSRAWRRCWAGNRGRIGTLRSAARRRGRKSDKLVERRAVLSCRSGAPREAELHGIRLMGFHRCELNSPGKYRKTIRRHTARHFSLARFHSIHLAEDRPNRTHSDSSNWRAVPFVVGTSTRRAPFAGQRFRTVVATLSAHTQSP